MIQRYIKYCKKQVLFCFFSNVLVAKVHCFCDFVLNLKVQMIIVVNRFRWLE